MCRVKLFSLLVWLTIVNFPVNGKSLDIGYGYDEIEEKLSHGEVSHSVDNRKGIVERNVGEVEGSGDSENDVVGQTSISLISSTATPTENATLSPNGVLNSTNGNETVDKPPQPAENTSLEIVKITTQPQIIEETTKSEEKLLLAVHPSFQNATKQNETIETLAAPIENPSLVVAQGFDHVLNATKQNNTIGPTVMSNGDSALAKATNDSPSLVKENAPSEILPKIGQSTEKVESAKPNTALLLVIAAVGIVGALAFVFNFIKRRRTNKELTETIRIENEGREMKEMKPLMKSGLPQNGSKSLEFIDAELQEEGRPTVTA